MCQVEVNVGTCEDIDFIKLCHHLQFTWQIVPQSRCYSSFQQCWMLSTNFWIQKVCWHCPAMFCLLPQVNFPANNLIFHWRWWDWIQAIFLDLFYFKYEVHLVEEALLFLLTVSFLSRFKFRYEAHFLWQSKNKSLVSTCAHHFNWEEKRDIFYLCSDKLLYLVSKKN